ncbi:MAG: radical SAM protein, partial [Elusimicrobia bacterium]|nr:radical SAM protein [Elusimicrobiota bacterium]
IEYYSLLSDIYKKRGDYRRGVEALKEAIKIAPDRAFLYGDLGKMLSYMGKDEEAIKHFKKASEKDPRDGSYNYEASKIFLQRNDFDKVLIETRSALEKNYESADLYIDAAKSARSLNRLKEAEEFYLKAGEISPNSKELWFQNRIKNDIEICQRKVRLDSLPRNLGVCLTNRCNLKCLMCEVRKEDWDISPERVGEVKEFFPYIEQVLWQGGEVFLSEHFLPLFSEASSYEHLSQVVLTSGMLIDRDWAKLFATSKTEVTFSLESVHRELYEKIRVGASFNKLKENLSLLNESRSRTPDSALKINLQMLVMEDNIRELDYLIAFAKDYGARKIFLIGLDETINKKNTFYDNPIYRKELGLILNKFFAEAAEKSIEVVNSLPISGWEEEGNPKEIEDSVSELELLYENKEEDPKEIICLWPWQQLSICSGGNAVINGLCPYLIVGNIDKQAIREIWNGEKIRGVREALLGENENNPCCTELCLSGGLPLGMLRLD